MSEIIYDKLVYGRELTPEQWSKLKYRPLDDKDMYGIAENPSFGIDKNLIGGGSNYVETFYYYPDIGNINVLCALFNIEAEHEEHQYLTRKQVYENTNEDAEPYLIVGPNYTGQDTPTTTLSADDWNALISGKDFWLNLSLIGEESTEMSIQDGSKSYRVGLWTVESGDFGHYIDSSNQELINALNENGLYISGNNLVLNSLSVESFDTADFTKISLSKTAPSIYESVLPTNYYLYIKEPFNIDNGENDYMIYGNIREGYLVSSSTFGKFYTSLQTYSTPNVEVYPDCVGMGIVSVSPQKSSYEALSEITMMAKANEGYMFSGWVLGGGLAIEEYQHTDMVGPTYYALFGRPVTITVEAEPTEGGTVSGGGTYASGSSVTLTATPNEGYEFLGWWEGEEQRTGSEVTEWQREVGSENTTYTAKFESTQILNSPTFVGEYNQEYSGTVGDTTEFVFTINKGQNNPEGTKLFYATGEYEPFEPIEEHNENDWFITYYVSTDESGTVYVIESTEDEIPQDVWNMSLPTSKYSQMIVGTYNAFFEPGGEGM